MGLQNENKMHKAHLTIFVSYSSKDRQIAEDIVKVLMRSQANVWFDTVNITPGNTILEEITRGIQSAQLLILVVSKHSLKSSWVNYEWTSFIDHRLRSHSPVYIIPVLIGDVRLPDAIARFRAIKLTNSRSSYQKIADSAEELVARYAHKKRGFHAISCEQIDRIVTKSTTIIKQTITVRPFDKEFKTFDCYHWQNAKGQIDIIRNDMIDQHTGKVIPHSIKIKQKDQNNLRFQYFFKLKELTPITFVHEISSRNYFPNLFRSGNGYTDLLVRYPIEEFYYKFICPNKKPYDHLFVDVQHKRKRKLKVQIEGAERVCVFHAKSINIGDSLKFIINNTNIKQSP